jgi:nudix-type nucleoside diphosphatase (YffH/AdpP family)
MAERAVVQRGYKYSSFSVCTVGDGAESARNPSVGPLAAMRAYESISRKMKPKILERETVYSGYLSIERLKVQLADGAAVWREVERHGDAVAVMPYDAARRCALIVCLFSAPVFMASGDATLEEACAGMIEDEDVEPAMRREANEELGVSLSALELVARVWSSPGVSTERQSLFFAPYSRADRKGQGGGLAGEHEGITIIERPLAELALAVDQQRIADAKLVTLVLALRHRRPELFA